MTSDLKEHYRKKAAAELAQRCDECKPRWEEVQQGIYVLHERQVPRDYFTDRPYPCEHFPPPMFNYDHGFPTHNGISVDFR